MKKLINNPLHVVPEMLEGLLAVYPGLARIDGYPVIVRSDLQQVRDRQVSLISGGGSGHEPAHAGFVGAGMLSAAVAGEVFTSPSSDSVLAAIRTVAGKLGVLLIVKNYTGDRLNFGLAAEIARSEGIKVELVVVADDVATASTQENTGARGIAGTVLVHKIAGAAAAEGRSLSEVARIARETAAAVATMGVSLSSGIVPAVGKPSFELSETEVELGLTLQQSLGGSSGPLYGVLFLKAGNDLAGNQDPTAEDWARAIGAASEELSRLGGAVPGEKTMLDALHPFVEAFSTSAKSGATAEKAFQIAAGEAEQGAERTRELMPRRGRASYLGQRAVGQPDPGAIALALWLRGVADAIR